MLDGLLGGWLDGRLNIRKVNALLTGLINQMEGRKEDDGAYRSAVDARWVGRLSTWVTLWKKGRQRTGNERTDSRAFVGFGRWYT